MNKFILTIAMPTIASSGNAFELHNAEVLEHKSWISGGDSDGVALAGHLEKKASALSSSSTA